MDTSYDLEPGTYVLSSFGTMDVKVADELVYQGKSKVRLFLPEGANVEVVTKYFPPKVKRLQMTDPVDPEPHEGLLSEPQPLTLQEQIARCIGQAFAERDGNQESFQEADDFDMDDDFDMPHSKYQLPIADDEQIFSTPTPSKEETPTPSTS